MLAAPNLTSGSSAAWRRITMHSKKDERNSSGQFDANQRIQYSNFYFQLVAPNSMSKLIRSKRFRIPHLISETAATSALHSHQNTTS